MVWQRRTYREVSSAGDLVFFEVVEGETDLQIGARVECAAAVRAAVRRVRRELTRYLAVDPLFGESFVPVEVTEDAPEIVRVMVAAASKAGVGPMAAVAGAVAECVARDVLTHSREVIVENGGDIFLAGSTARRVLLLADGSPLSGRIAIALEAGDLPVSVCTSSGKIGHSVSLGEAHAATVVAGSGALADAVATGLGNRVTRAGDIEHALQYAQGIDGVRGAVVIVGDRIGAIGNVRLVPAAS